MGAIQIFQQASQGDPSWRLTIKSRKADGINEVARIARADKRIEVVIEDSHPLKVLDYYHSHDCLLWPSKGEGVGLPPLEALSCGLEVVCSANSGMLDFIDGKWAWPIRTERMEPAGWPDNLLGFDETYVRTYGDVGEWWLPDLNHATKQLRAAHEAWSKGNGKGRLGAAEIRRNHTLRHQAESVLVAVERYL
jgi:glycosyltransferase involved in cell wall biosynthesis